MTRTHKTSNQKILNQKRLKLINIIGIDGAGKTTLAKGLAHKLKKQDPNIRYAYCQYFAKLLYPIKLLAKLTVMRRTNEFKNYGEYNRTKQQTSRKYPFFAGIYTAVWLMDYLFQIFFKVVLKLLAGQHLVIDRYIFDIAVNLSLTAGRDTAFARRLIDRFFWFCPRPDHVFFIDLPEEIALSRKDDIQDIAYLTERRRRYLILAEVYGFTVLDGTMSRTLVLENALEALNPESSGIKTILYIHANNQDVGGADYCLFKLTSQLDKKRFRPVVCLSKQTKILELYKKEGIKTYVIEMERLKKSINPLYLITLLYKFFFTIRTLRKIIRKEHAALVHGNDLLDIYGPVAALLENRPATQYVRWILESPVWLKKLIASMVYRLNTCVMTVSNAVAQKMFSNGQTVKSRVVTCYDWIDMAGVGHKKIMGDIGDIREEYGWSPGTPLVGCVGRLEQWKGQDVFVRAAAIVLQKMPDTKFLVVGGEVEGRGRESFGQTLKYLATNLGIGNQLIFAGQRDNIADIMESLDVFVHASVTPDPLPGVVMEAMACATPVVGANAGGVPEEMADQKTGYLYPPGNPDAMAEKIIQLLNDPQKAKQMGLSGQERVYSVFEKTKLCNRIEHLYETIIHTYQSQGRSKETDFSCVPTPKTNLE